MPKAVLLSVQPYYVFLIIAKAMGWDIDIAKSVEVRKSCPKADDWDKTVKIYCSKDKKSFARIPKEYQPLMQPLLGKVIGEFVCDTIITDKTFGHDALFKAAACVSDAEIAAYCVNSKMYGWHISDLVIYDKPKELSEFYTEDFEEIYSNWEDLFTIGVPSDCSAQFPPEPKREDYIVKRPPQSWCYVEG